MDDDSFHCFILWFISLFYSCSVMSVMSSYLKSEVSEQTPEKKTGRSISQSMIQLLDICMSFVSIGL